MRSISTRNTRYYNPVYYKRAQMITIGEHYVDSQFEND